MAWHPPLIEFCRKRLATDSILRPYAKQIAEDGRTLLRSHRPWDGLANEVPATLFIETTNICNANCVFCAYQYQAGFRKGKGVMSDELFHKSLEDYRAMGGETSRKRINFPPLVGEPLVDPKIIKRAR